MSTQLKNAGKLKVFFLSHGEKLGMLLVGLLAGWLVYGSTGRDSVDDQPADLSKLVTNTRTQIDGFTWDNAMQADPPPRLHTEFQATAAKTITPDSYSISKRGWDRATVAPTVYREDPVLLAPIELEGQGYTVRMAFYSDEEAKKRILADQREEEKQDRERELERERSRDNNDNARRRGRRDMGPTGRESDPDRRRVTARLPRDSSGVSLSGEELIDIKSCAIVLAKVPVADQVKIFEDIFENALGFNPSRDVPRYLGYKIQRAEATTEGELKWETVKIRNGRVIRNRRQAPLPAVTADNVQKSIADWVQGGEEPVDMRYYHNALTFPLPPMLGRTWGREVVHSDLPLAVETAAALDELEGYEEVEETDEDDLFGGTGAGGIGARPGAGGRSGLGRPRGGYGAARPGRRGAIGGIGPVPMESNEGEMGGGGRRSAISGDFDLTSEFAMIRFVDFGVRPGRRYVYRFQLLMLDVNGRTQTSLTYLSKEVRERVREDTSRVPFRTTDWSEPSPPISIPLAGRVMVAEAQRSSNGDATVNLVVESFDFDSDRNALQASVEKEKVRLGSVMNFVEKDAWVLDESGGRRGGGLWLARVENFNFRTGVTLLDIGGGEKLPGKMVAPASALVMDATGRLMVRSQLKDEAEVELFRDIYNEEEDSRRGGGFDEGGDVFELEF